MHYAGSMYSVNSDFQKAYHEIFKSKPMRSFLQTTPLVYSLDDHDSGANNADGNSQSVSEANIAYRAVVPHFPLPMEKGLW